MVLLVYFLKTVTRTRPLCPSRTQARPGAQAHWQAATSNNRGIDRIDGVYVPHLFPIYKHRWGNRRGSTSIEQRRCMRTASESSRVARSLCKPLPRYVDVKKIVSLKSTAFRTTYLHPVERFIRFVCNVAGEIVFWSAVYHII